MKKAILPMLLLCFVASCLIAVESSPSSTVGFLKYTVAPGYNKFVLPFTFNTLVGGTLTETMTFNDIVGNQLTGGTVATGDQIVNNYTGTYGYLNGTTHLWAGTVTSFTDNVPYSFRHRSAGNLSVFLAGTVQRELQTVGTFNAGYRLAALREAGSVPLANLDLNPGGATGFTGGTNPSLSDQLISVKTGQSCWYNANTHVWVGTMTASEPGYPMALNVRAGHHSIVWVYDPSSRGSESHPALNNSK
jgi:hypothetical protein